MTSKIVLIVPNKSTQTVATNNKFVVLVATNKGTETPIVNVNRNDKPTMSREVEPVANK